MFQRFLGGETEAPVLLVTEHHLKGDALRKARVHAEAKSWRAFLAHPPCCRGAGDAAQAQLLLQALAFRTADPSIPTQLLGG